MRTRNLMRVAVATGAVLGLLASPAHAATTIGETFDPAGAGGSECQGGYVFVQSTSPSQQYVVPQNGVITEWSHQAEAPDPLPLKFVVARRLVGNDFQIVARSSEITPNPGTLGNYAFRATVQSGDVIGLRVGTGGASDAYCARVVPGYDIHYFFGDPAPPTSATFTPLASRQLDVSARLEADADNDGFGDETQDQCPTSAATQGDCDPPETTITKGAPNKTDESKVKFKFKSDEAGSTFRCKVDKKPWKGCTSPKKVKRLDEGRHKFKVRATDAAGNPDPTPDKDKFKVVE